MPHFSIHKVRSHRSIFFFFFIYCTEIFICKVINFNIVYNFNLSNNLHINFISLKAFKLYHIPLWGCQLSYERLFIRHLLKLNIKVLFHMKVIVMNLNHLIRLIRVINSSCTMFKVFISLWLSIIYHRWLQYGGRRHKRGINSHWHSR
jgi:hypothetical protein